jgi:hypothetical protein
MAFEGLVVHHVALLSEAGSLAGSTKVEMGGSANRGVFLGDT